VFLGEEASPIALIGANAGFAASPCV
jgi:hypothetical protein